MLREVLLGQSKYGEQDGQGMGETAMHTLLWLENLKGRDHLGDLNLDGRRIIN
jgi:hypothetical protein